MTARLAVLAVACAVLLPSELHAQGVPPARKQKMREAGWTDRNRDFASARWDEHGRIDEFNRLVADARWKTDQTCTQHKADMKSFLDGAIMYWAEDGVATREGQTLRLDDGNVVEWLVVFNWDLYDQWNDDAMLNLLLHEGWHWVHKETEEGTAAGKAEDCAWIPNKEDDDNPSDPGGTTCTEEEYTYTEWDWVYTEIEAGSCVGVSPVRWPWEEGGDDGEMHCTPAKWGYVLMEVEKTGVRTVCVPTSN